MTVKNIAKDTEALTMTLTAEFDASVDRVWELWSDPRQLERWWGPPTYPATVDEHDLRPGGRVAYHMTGPEGDQPRGLWEVQEVNPPHSLSFRDLFADESGEPNADLPGSTVRVTIRDIGGGRTEMSMHSRFDSAEGFEQLLGMGMEEGLRDAVGQIDAILAEPMSSASTGSH